METKTENLRKNLAVLKEIKRRQTFRKLDFFKAYPKQAEFMALGANKRERMLIAGNQLGKTECGAAEAAMHLTGEYPPGWVGRRFDHPVRAWICGVTATSVRDIQQAKLCGRPGVEDEFGAGLIPKENFVDKPTLSRGATDAYDTIQVTHRTNGKVDGVSTAKFLSYEQGREKFQGEPIDFGWADEEPPMDVYSELLTRITATRGMVYVTFTPLKGRSDVVLRYLDEESPERSVVTMTIFDALHVKAEDRDAIIAGYPAHEREARAYGVPMMGEGRIFQYADEQISEPQLYEVPVHWAKLWGIDFGIAHPFAAVLIGWDKDTDVIHVLHAYRASDQGPLQHATAMKYAAPMVRVAWPQDGTQRDKGSLDPIAKQYTKHGLKMLGGHATWPDGSVSTEAGLLEMDERFATGRLKVAAHLTEWFEEFRFYHRKDGLIVKVKDDLLSATRVAIMAKRFAGPGALKALGNSEGRGWSGQGRGTMARNVDFDVFA